MKNFSQKNFINLILKAVVPFYMWLYLSLAEDHLSFQNIPSVVLL